MSGSSGSHRLPGSLPGSGTLYTEALTLTPTGCWWLFIGGSLREANCLFELHGRSAWTDASTAMEVTRL